jgi:hypothetical protein
MDLTFLNNWLHVVQVTLFENTSLETRVMNSNRSIDFYSKKLKCIDFYSIFKFVIIFIKLLNMFIH